MTPPAHLQPTAVAAVAAPGRVGQATAVEQSRAVAEVLAAVQVAQSCPRDENRAYREMRKACGKAELANRAFYRVPRGGGNVDGPSVHLARELARAWGNLDYGFGELRRDDEARQSEIRAWAWDQETNTRSSSTFIVPHARDKGGRPQPLVELRDIYLNNNNEAARRVREAIFAVLPDEFIEEAKDLCQATLRTGNGKPVAERAAAAIEAFALLGVTQDQLEAKLLRPLAQWDGRDLGHLTVIHNSINRGEVLVAEEFPPRRVDTAELAAQAAEDQADTELDTELATGGVIPPGTLVVVGEEPPFHTMPPANEDGEPTGQDTNVLAPNDPPTMFVPITLDDLVDAGRAAGHWDGKTGLGLIRKRLVTLATNVCGTDPAATPEQIVADEVAAEQLLVALQAEAEARADG